MRLGAIKRCLFKWNRHPHSERPLRTNAKQPMHRLQYQKPGLLCKCSAACWRRVQRSHRVQPRIAYWYHEKRLHWPVPVKSKAVSARHLYMCSWYATLTLLKYLSKLFGYWLCPCRWLRLQISTRPNINCIGYPDC